MNGDPSIPPLRDLPPNRLTLRREHLLSEIAGSSRTSPTAKSPAPRAGEPARLELPLLDPQVARELRIALTAVTKSGAMTRTSLTSSAKLQQPTTPSDPHRQVPNWRRNDAPAATPSRPTA